jgi:hypothetical protein
VNLVNTSLTQVKTFPNFFTTWESHVRSHVPKKYISRPQKKFTIQQKNHKTQIVATTKSTIPQDGELCIVSQLTKSNLSQFFYHVGATRQVPRSKKYISRPQKKFTIPKKNHKTQIVGTTKPTIPQDRRVMHSSTTNQKPT